MIHFTVPAVPVAQPRPRAVAIAGQARLYEAAKAHPVHAFKASCRLAAREVYTGPPLDEPLELTLIFVLPRPAKRDGRKHQSEDSYPHTKKPDVDNLTKSCLDALTGLLWTDDTRIWKLACVKQVAAADQQPHVQVCVSICEGEESDEKQNAAV